MRKVIKKSNSEGLPHVIDHRKQVCDSGDFCFLGKGGLECNFQVSAFERSLRVSDNHSSADSRAYGKSQTYCSIGLDHCLRIQKI